MEYFNAIISESYKILFLLLLQKVHLMLKSLLTNVQIIFKKTKIARLQEDPEHQ